MSCTRVITANHANSSWGSLFLCRNSQKHPQPKPNNEAKTKKAGKNYRCRRHRHHPQVPVVSEDLDLAPIQSLWRVVRTEGEMKQQQPLFQEAARCDVCKCCFTAFRRRHHCRCCGRTLCSEHSSAQMTLPQFGINSPVRVCADCFNDSSQYGDHVAKPSINGADQIDDSVAGLDISPEAVPAVEPVVQGNPKCKCGMPLCICEAPGPCRTLVKQPMALQESLKWMM